MFKSKFLSEVLPESDDDVYIYTDGSKQDKHMIVAILCMSVVCILLDFIVVVDFYWYFGSQKRLIVSYNDSIIFTDEIEVINKAMRLIKMKISKSSIFSNKKSSRARSSR